MKEAKYDFGTEVIIRSLPIVYSYLKKEDISNPDFMFMSKKLYNNFHSKKMKEIKDTYEGLKIATPMKFNKLKELKELSKLIFIINKEDIIVPLLIPAKEMDYFNELTAKDMILFYKQRYLRQLNAKKENQLISYIFLGDHWNSHLLPFLSKTPNKSKGLKTLIDYIIANYFNIKADLFLKNYQSFLNKNISNNAFNLD